MEAFRRALVLTGPTGSGKSALGVRLAERLGAEIVSMDSMALYRGMDIGTAKPDADLRRRVPHHLLDVLDPGESASVAWWIDQAARCCRDIEARGRRVLIVGGTALYLKAMLCGLFDGPPADPELRRQLEEEAAAVGKQALHDRLARVDPASAARLHPNDLRRVVRALEVFQLTGRPLSSWQTQWRESEDRGSKIEDRRSRIEDRESDRGLRIEDREADSLATSVDPLSSILHPLSSILDPPSSIIDARVLWLDLPRAELHRRIDARVEAMFAAGLVEECRRLLERPISKEARQALGYKETFEYLAGQASLADTIRKVQARSRQFAKRQVTWFRHLPGCLQATEELTFTLWRI